MSAPRSSLRALRVLSQPTAPSARRCLHITGVQSAQPANTTDKAISNHDVLQSRAFAIAMRRINGNAFSDTPRQFNTSRSSKARNDTSTVDLVYMPTMADLDAAPLHRGIQVPVLPETHSITFSSTPSAPPMKPQIYTVAGTGADVAASAMSEVVDNHAVDLDPFSFTEAVGRSRVGEEMNRRQNGGAKTGVMRELWAGFLDDVMGPKEVRK
ncbi:hypothetical protein N7508_000625 [Penicillium antarcticum]|uniref:uncharacterized protein n=1 Tax=Penicillium antarcticum TaxID=416450 RepID=UPI002383B733|nr:uncharacterized protein N7508_000625 [Penicillium antarcticum]KAJ5320342.1 hypothetical protein N7508_000625 [Penicillium antarcticum]